MKRLGMVALCAAMFAAPAWAASVVVTSAFARATLPGSDTGVVYMTLESDTGDKLTGASTPVAVSAMMHKTSMAGMVMSMDMVSAIDLPAGQKVVLQPDQLHIMLEGLRHPLVKGTTIPLQLIFAKSPAETVTVPVAGFAAMTPGG
jgi:copper(I)-binding protein